jgi:squalene-associated FAD-dependent desaturase
VTLVEVRPQLGGAAYSFERDGLQIDNGQHVFLRCCTAYRGLLARLGSEAGVKLQSRLDIPVLSPGRPAARLRRSALPAPAHLASALLRYTPLSLSERIGVARAARALASVDHDDPGTDGETFGEWLLAHGQSERAITDLWDLIALPTINVPARQASLRLAAFVFQTGLLGDAGAADVGLHVAPLIDIIGRPASVALGAAGVHVRLRARVEAIEPGPAGLRVSLADGPLQADAVVLAAAHARAAELLPTGAASVAERLRALDSSPIVNLHVIYDRGVCDLDFAAGVGTPVQYVFDRSESVGLSRGRYLAVSVSAAEREMAMTVDELRATYLPALADLFPAARAASVDRFIVSREHAATFRGVPGSAALRPGPESGVPGLLLAGAFTATGWPATLEGAVRSGHTAAQAALGHLGLPGARGGDAVDVGGAAAVTVAVGA